MDYLKSEAVLHLADMIITLVLLKGTLLVGVFALVGTLARKASAAKRASLWILAFGSLLALPFAWRMIPWWQAGLVRFPRSLFRDASAGAEGVGAAGTVAHLAPEALAAQVASVPVASYIAVAWLAGTLLLLLRFLVQRAGVELIARRGEPVRDPRCLAAAGRIAAELGVSRPVRLVYNDVVATPATFGVRRPVLLLPSAARSWAEDRLAAVLYHELAHVQRRDYAGLLLVELVRALYWPNPLVLLAARRVRECQDLACDDTALRCGVAAVAYARHLLEVARTLGVRRVPQAALPLIRRTGLGDRVRSVLDRTSDRGAVSAGTLGRWAVLALLLCAALGSADLWHCGGGSRYAAASPGGSSST